MCRVLYKLAITPLSGYVFFLALLQTFGYVVIYFGVLALRWRWVGGAGLDEAGRGGECSAGGHRTRQRWAGWQTARAGRQAGQVGMPTCAIGNGRVATPLHGPPLRRSGRVEAAMLDVPRQQAGTFLGIGVVEAL